MPDTLAQKIRTKYPGAYDDLSDQVLETKWRAKYPGAYDDLPSTPEAPTTEAQPAVGQHPLAAVGSAVVDAAKGAGAGLASTVFHGGDLIRRGLGMERVIDKPDVQAGITPPDSFAGKLGFAGEQIAEGVIPGNAVAKAAKGARLGARMLAEGATLAGVTALQGGDPKTAMVVGAAGPAIGAGLSKVVPPLRAAAEKKVAQALGATKERFKAIAAKRAPEILERGLRGSRQQLLTDAVSHAQEAAGAIDDVLNHVGTQPIGTQPILAALDEAKSAFQSVRQVPMAEAVRTGLHQAPGAVVKGNLVEVPIVLDQRPIAQLTKLQGVLTQMGDEVPVEKLVAVRRVWDDVVARAGGFSHRSSGAFGVPLAEQTEAWAKKEATTAIRKALAAEVPDLAKVNAEYAFWKDLQDVLTATEKRTQAQGVGLQRIVGAVAGAGAGFSSGGDMSDRLQNAVIGGIVVPKVLQGMTSAQWRLVDAGARNALAAAIESGVPGRIAAAASRVTAMAASRRTPAAPAASATPATP